MQILFLLILLLFSTNPAPINTILPPLLKYQYTFPSENFTIKNRQNFVYEFQSYGDPQVNITDFTGKQSTTTNSCSFQPSTIEHQLLAQYKLPLRDKSQWASAKATFIVAKFEHLIYTITNALELTAYSYTENKISKIASIVLLPNVDDYLDSRTYFILSSDESVVFLFSTYGVWKIQTKAILTKIEKLDLKLDFTVYGAVKIGEWILLSTISKGIVIYQLTPIKTLVLIGAITEHQQNQISPVDLSFDSQSGLLFVLDTRKNIYIYKMVERTFYYYDVIQFQHSANFKIAVVSSRIYYSFLQGINMEIAELQYNETSKTAELIRYYKEFDSIYDFLPTATQLYVLSHETLDVYPSFIDPRLITNAHGIRLPISSRRFQHLISDIYLFTSPQFLSLIKLKTTKSHITCNFRKAKQSILITFKSKVSDCSSYSISSVKTSYNSYCQIQKNITIDINIPQDIERQKILMYAVVIMVVMFFFAGLICLVQWRNGRLDIIDKLADEIRRYREKEKRARQFVEENDIEVPRSMVFSSHESEV